MQPSRAFENNIISSYLRDLKINCDVCVSGQWGSPLYVSGACKTIYIRKTIYILHMQNYMFCTRYILLHMQKHIFVQNI